MPYKNPEHNEQWESLHRSQRLARRRELRRIDEVRRVTNLEASPPEGSLAPLVWLPIAGSVALASHSPKLAISAGSATLLGAALFKKDWIWWFVGALIVTVGLLFQWNDKNVSRETKIANKNLGFLGRAQ